MSELCILGSKPQCRQLNTCQSNADHRIKQWLQNLINLSKLYWMEKGNFSPSFGINFLLPRCWGLRIDSWIPNNLEARSWFLVLPTVCMVYFSNIKICHPGKRQYILCTSCHLHRKVNTNTAVFPLPTQTQMSLTHLIMRLLMFWGQGDPKMEVKSYSCLHLCSPFCT